MAFPKTVVSTPATFGPERLSAGARSGGWLRFSVMKAPTVFHGELTNSKQHATPHFVFLRRATSLSNISRSQPRAAEKQKVLWKVRFL
jgi:hypothetical protein